jgi:hypothetical protein
VTQSNTEAPAFYGKILQGNRKSIMNKYRRDGYAYKLITRRSVAILKRMPRTSIDRATSVDRDSLIADLHNESEPELYLKRFERNISNARLLYYLRFHAKLGILALSSDKVHFHSDFVPADTDQQWVNALADQARLHLESYLKEKYLKNQSKSVADRIKAAVTEIHDSGEVATLRTLVDLQGLENSTDAEQFRWALYLYLDGDDCPIRLRHVVILESTP